MEPSGSYTWSTGADQSGGAVSVDDEIAPMAECRSVQAARLVLSPGHVVAHCAPPSADTSSRDNSGDRQALPVAHRPAQHGRQPGRAGARRADLRPGRGPAAGSGHRLTTPSTRHLTYAFGLRRSDVRVCGTSGRGVAPPVLWSRPIVGRRQVPCRREPLRGSSSRVIWGSWGRGRCR